ncbi:translocation/assembly module TamB domain-containing protein [Niabella terrae]
MLVILLAVSLNIPAVQNLVKNKVVSYLKVKTGTEIRLEKVRIHFPTGLRLDKFYIADQKQDTLLYAGTLAVQLNMWGLLKNRIAVSEIRLQQVYGNVHRLHPDTIFNYQFLVDSFVSEEQEPEPVSPDSTATLKLELDKILLDDIRLQFKDDVVGNDAGVFFKTLHARVEKVDLDRMHYVLDQLELGDSRLHYYQTKPLTVLQQTADAAIDATEAASGGNLPLIEVKNLNFHDVDIRYDDRLSDTRALAYLKKFLFRDLVIDLTQGSYRTAEGELSNSVIDFAYRPTPANEAALESAADSVADSPFSLYLDKILLANNQIRYNDLSAPKSQGLDFSHLNISGLGISGTDIAIDSAGIRAAVAGGKLRDTSGFVLNELRGKFVYDDRQLQVEDLLLKTPNTQIDNNSLLTYRSPEDFSKHPENVTIDVRFRNSVLGLADAWYFMPALPAAYRHQRLRLEAFLRGRMSDLNIDKLRLQGLQQTDIDISGNIRGLPEIDHTFFDLKIARLNTSKSDILALVPAGSLPGSIELPGYLAANGQFRGTMHKFNTRLNLRSDMGSARINAAMAGSERMPSYTADLDLDQFDLGRLLKRDDLGKMSLRLDLNGRGTSAETAQVALKGQIKQADYNQYRYNNILLDGRYGGQQLELNVNSADSNAHFTLASTVNMKGKYPSAQGQMDLKNIDLQKLHFSDSELKLAGRVDLDFPTLDPDYLNGRAMVTSIQVVTDGRTINLDTISVDALATAEHNSLQLRSEILDADLSGKYQLTQIGQAFINQVARYYAFAPIKKTDPQRVQFSMNIPDSKLLHELVPSLSGFASSSLSGIINTETDSLVLAASFPYIAYDSFNVRNTTLNVENLSDTSKLAYGLLIKSIESPSINLYNAAISGTAADSLLDVNIYLRDSKDQDKYRIGGVFKAANQTYQFRLDPNKLLLNYDPWQVAADNLIQYGEAGVYVRNFEISNQGQSLSINSTRQETNAPLKVEFKDFLLETLTRYAEQDTSIVGGRLNGTVDVSDIATTPKIEADLIVDRLRYQKDQLGDVHILADNLTPDAYKIDLSLTGVHDVHAQGFYYTKDAGVLDMQLDINRFDLKYIESLSAGQIRDGSGLLTGQLSAKGPLTAPKVLGNLRFKEAALNVAQLNSKFRFKDENISFLDNGIRFNNFTILDSAGQSFTMNGMVKTTDYQNFGFDLKLRANNFMALNSTQEDNELFYGKVFLTVNANIGGDMNKPDVTGSVRVNKDTRFFFAIPDSDPGIVNQEGIVEFVDMDAPPENGREPLDVDSLTRSPLKGINASMDLLTEKEAEITIVVDPTNGDALLVKGEAELNVTMDPSGKLSMTGRYLISDGNYNLSIGGLAKRKFILQQGSVITWTGAPTEANIDITAVYTVNTSPIDLVANEIQSEDASTRNTYKQKLPFTVYLKMTNQLLKPNIAFEISMPENEKNAFNGIVYARLQQVNSNPSELNKQVFALLALNRFISENPFESLSGGVSPEMLARQSVSRLLTQQLNNLAADLIKGVDISFDLESQDDYSSGSAQTRTDLNVALSKRFLNDRLTVTVGNNFALEGAGKKTNSNGVNLAGNVNIEYALSRDGRYRLRAYRRNQSDLIIEGQIIETGLGFAMVVDYNEFREIFRSLKSREKLRKEWEERRKAREAADSTNAGSRP